MSRNDPDQKLPISVCVITLNEEDHIGRCLDSVSWAADRIVVDSGSDDRTTAIAKDHGARVMHNDWPGFLRQKQFATDRASHDWILSLDADEWVSSELASSIQSIFSEGPPSPSTGYQVNRLSWYLDRWMYHGGWQPDWILRIFNRKNTEWGGQDPHAHVVPTEHVEKLDGYLLHDPYENLSDHMSYLDRYTTEMAEEKHADGETATLFTACSHAYWKFWRDYVFKRGFLDGSSGFINAAMASFYVFLKYTKLRQLSTNNTPASPPDEPKNP